MSQGFAYLVIMHNFSLIEYIASGEEGAVTNYMNDIELCQKSPDEDNIVVIIVFTSTRIATGDCY